MFLNNKYTTWYMNIIKKAQDRNILDGYSENHHIIPKSLSGQNNKENIVRLTAREHFIVHWLLMKMVSETKHVFQMANAFNRMLSKGRDDQFRYYPSSKIYELARIESNIKRKGMPSSNKGKPSPFKGRTHSEESKKKVGNANRGKKRSEETKKKLSVAGKIRKHSEETKKKMSESAKGPRPNAKGRIAWNKGKKHSEETKKKIGDTQRGKPKNKEVSLSLSQLQI